VHEDPSAFREIPCRQLWKNPWVLFRPAHITQQRLATGLGYWSKQMNLGARSWGNWTAEGKRGLRRIAAGAVTVSNSDRRRWLRRSACGLLATVLLNCSTPCWAQASSAPFARKISIQATVLSGAKLETIATEDIEIKSQPAIAAFGQIVLQNNEHFTDVEITEAATVKADGRRISVAADRILISGIPNSPVLGIFQADVKVRTIVFPDVAVGDTLHYRTRTRDRLPHVAGGFSMLKIIPASARYESVVVSLDSPKNIPLHISILGFSEKTEFAGDRRRFTWTLSPQQFRAEEPGSTSAFDRDPHLIISSYRDLQFIGQKFFEGAAAKSKPTPAIKALADQIVAGTTDRREQARLIYDYVSKNIRYMAIFLGSGGWVPHESSSILAAKYGDCKDHTTLMRALLAARGIDADYALINISAIYKTFDVPIPLYDHVILYLPEFDLYVDPTAMHASFQSLPEYEADKPVLRSGKNGARVARTPPLSAASNRLSVIADVTLRPDGTPVGKSTVEASGPVAAALRGAMAQAALKGGSDFAKEKLSAQNWRGTGTLDLRDPTDHSEPYQVSMTFDLNNRFFGDGPNTNAIPIGPQMVSPAFSAPLNFVREKRTQDFTCASQTFSQVIDLHLPTDQSLTKIPRDVDVSAASLATYKATYRVNGSVLHVERRVVLNLPGQVCTGQVAKEVSAVVLAVLNDLTTPLEFTKSIKQTQTSPKDE
jgi:transglutaminase-like putative cysteine protease